MTKMSSVTRLVYLDDVKWTMNMWMLPTNLVARTSVRTIEV